MKIKIISGGTPVTTEVVNAETGEPLAGVISIKWRVTVKGICRAQVTFANVPVDVVGVLIAKKK